MQRLVLAILAVLMVSACGSRDRGLHDFRNTSTGPDEFSVAPTQPLEVPANYTELPTPTLGAANLTDSNPSAQAIAALGGNAAAVQGGIPARDTALVSYAGRNGVTANIRSVLAEEDSTFRKRRGRISGFGSGNKYFTAYAGQSLDAYAELIRWRQLGVKTPSAPPAQ